MDYDDDKRMMDAFSLRFQLQLTVIISKENNRRKKLQVVNEFGNIFSKKKVVNLKIHSIIFHLFYFQSGFK